MRCTLDNYCVTFFIFFVTNFLVLNFCLLRLRIRINVRVLIKHLIAASGTVGNLVVSSLTSDAITFFSFRNPEPWWARKSFSSCSTALNQPSDGIRRPPRLKQGTHMRQVKGTEEI